jgi:tripartite-type tricarboxylate transporter receptor subunit TctC
MSIDRRTLLGAVGAFGATLPLPRRAAAQRDGWPSRPVRVVVPFPPGGPFEPLRPAMLALQAAFGQPFIYDYRPGATGSIGSTLVARSAPDGHTLLMSSLSSQVIAPLVLSGLGFDPARDLAPIGVLAQTPLILVAHPAVAGNGLADLVGFARARPGELSYASPGIGSAGHLTAELFLQRAGIQALHVPFTGPAAALNAVVAGHAHCFFDTLANGREMVASGRVRGLALAGSSRLPALPTLPTFAEAGYPEVVSEFWVGLHAPAGTPSAIIEAVNLASVRFLAQSEAALPLQGIGFVVATGTPAAMEERILRESRLLAEVVRQAGIRAG